MNTVVKGSLLVVEQTGEMVRLWVASPTGDSSDCHVFEIPCANVAQAEEVATYWRLMQGHTNVKPVEGRTQGYTPEGAYIHPEGNGAFITWD